jgi:hypothetical protein
MSGVLSFVTLSLPEADEGSGVGGHYGAWPMLPLPRFLAALGMTETDTLILSLSKGERGDCSFRHAASYTAPAPLRAASSSADRPSSWQ